MDSPAHFPPPLAVYVNGRQVTVPANVGIVPDEPPMQMAGLLPHDTSGTIHDEGMSSSRLGQFFSVWGGPFSAGRLGPYRASGPQAVRVWDDRKPPRAFGALGLADGQQTPRPLRPKGASPAPPRT